MKYFSRYAVAVVVLLSFTWVSCGVDQSPVSSDNEASAPIAAKAAVSTVVPDHYIVVLHDNIADVPRAAAALTRAHGASPKHIYRHALKGFSVALPAQAVAALANNPQVKYIEPDQVVTLNDVTANKGKPGSGGGTPPAQTIPWGVTRVGGAGNGTGKTAWIIDTGIDLDHQDLTVDVARSISYITTGKDPSPNDSHGHGTHVAGTIAAINNSIGVVGVAAGATVVSVRVLDQRGSGTTSGVIAGVDYVAGNGAAGDVANMSLGGGVSPSLDDAVTNAAGTGVFFVLAAGNESDDANNHSPARANGENIFTVSAFGNGDAWASFSNFGNPPVDYAAPGVSVLSLYKNGGTATMSGTSMAAPHVAGVLLLGLPNVDGYVNNDPDGNPDPIAHW